MLFEFTLYKEMVLIHNINVAVNTLQTYLLLFFIYFGAHMQSKSGNYLKCTTRLLCLQVKRGCGRLPHSTLTFLYRSA